MSSGTAVESGPGSDGASVTTAATEPASAGVERVARILGGATNARWPMYLRNVKQILRQAEGGFDERRYGFGGLMDLLRTCQREGILRMERDHRGGLRVFQGQALRSAPGQPIARALPLEVPVEIPDAGPTEPERVEPMAIDDVSATEPSEVEPIPIDTTAELLGRAKHRKPRVRVLSAPVAATPRPAPRAARGQRAPKKAAPRRASHRA
jgi:hypothetical protein